MAQSIQPLVLIIEDDPGHAVLIKTVFEKNLELALD
jgi:hypothetical protein